MACASIVPKQTHQSPPRQDKKEFERLALVCHFCFSHSVELATCPCRIHLFCRECMDFDHECCTDQQLAVVRINTTFERADQICLIAGKILNMNRQSANPHAFFSEAFEKGLFISIPIPHIDGNPLGSTFMPMELGVKMPPLRYVDVKYKTGSRIFETPLSKPNEIVCGLKPEGKETVSLPGINLEPDYYKDVLCAFKVLQEIVVQSRRQHLQKDVFCLVVAPKLRCLISSHQSASKSGLEKTIDKIHHRTMECLANSYNYSVVLVRPLFS